MRWGHREVNLVVNILGAMLLLLLLASLSGCQSYQPPGGDLWVACKIAC